MGKLYAVGFGPGGYEHMTAKAIDVIKNADVILVMRDGKIVEQGETREVLEYPKEEYTKLLMEYSL